MNEKLSPELQDLAEMEGAALCREMQRQSATIARTMVREAVELAIILMNNPNMLQEYIDKFDLE